MGIELETTTETFANYNESESLLQEILSSIDASEIVSCTGSCAMMREMNRQKNREVSPRIECYSFKNLIQILNQLNQIPVLEEENLCDMASNIDLEKKLDKLIGLIQEDILNEPRINSITLSRIGIIYRNILNISKQ